MKHMVMNTFGHISAEEKTFIPESEWPNVIRVARAWFLIYAATIALALYLGSYRPDLHGQASAVMAAAE